jgi:BirA family biotin operon repressor/biotin-[acetyl-CoA-carboxylase] ligase
MPRLDAGLLREALPEQTAACLDGLEVFERIGSTNTHLLGKRPPAHARFHVAITDDQSEGRGRQDRRWVAPPGSGLCLSCAWSFRERLDELPSLTLALGVGIADALAGLGIDDITLKWPNDIVAADGKLGGILTETRAGGEGVTVVAGIGLNLSLPPDAELGLDSGWVLAPVDLARVAPGHPPRERVAAALIAGFHQSATAFAAEGFAAFADAWRGRDWLRGRRIVVTGSGPEVRGVAAGVDADGALLVTTGRGPVRVIAGSIRLAGDAGE